MNIRRLRRIHQVQTHNTILFVLQAKLSAEDYKEYLGVMNRVYDRLGYTCGKRVQDLLRIVPV